MSAATEPVEAIPALEMIEVAVPTGPEPDAALLRIREWTVRRGEYFVIAGTTGSGKSALLETAGALQRPARGTHRLLGRDVSALNEEELAHVRQRVGLVFAGGGRLFSQMTVAENVALPLCYHRNCAAGEASETLRPLFQATGLSDKLHVRAGRLTRDWRQRVALARALALQPEVLLLDNPLAGLEPRQLRWWLGFLGRLWAGHEWLRGQPLTVVVTCDDLRPFLGAAQRFGLLAAEELVTVGTRQELERREEPLLRELLGEETRVE